ncbi:MAG: DUF1629 domain-containing protein [Glutamicibacter sp.]|uniref:imm11 family protein n=1 Tax=Bacteria TaxID=2 RepID=UPI002FC81545
MDRKEDRPKGEATNAPRPGEFYVVRPDFDTPPHEVSFENVQKLRPNPGGIIRPADGGFPDFGELPRLRETSPDHTLTDYQNAFEGYWLVSDRLKTVFESVDPCGFEFRLCEFIRFDGVAGGAYYLCDVARVLDAIDEDASTLEIFRDGYPAGKYYGVAGARLAFKKDILEGAHVFRSPFNGQLIVIDRIMRDALIEQGIGTWENGSGMCLDDASDY